MNVFNKVTLQSLKKNKTRTIVTIIGIILSAAMICAVTTFASSMMNYAKETTIYTDGNWHACERNTTFQKYNDILYSGKTEQTVYLQQLGYAYAEGCKNEYKPYIYVLGAGKGAEEVLPIHMISGRYPTSPDEILLPEHLYTNGGVKYSLGDTVTLELGQRMLDGEALTQGSPCYFTKYGDAVFNGEALVVGQTRTYTVVGFYERLSWRIEGTTAPGYTAITLADETPDPECAYDVYFRMEDPQDTYAFMEEMGVKNYNTKLLMYSGTFVADSFSQMLYSLCAIVIALIMLGSVAVIYNAFSISVSERTKQFGLLSSVGATKSQLRRMVLTEAMVVSAIGIPLGVLAGVGGIGITLLLIGDKFQSMTGMPIDMRISVSPASIMIAAVIALTTVLLSAWIPSKRATKVSAVEAIRQNLDVNAKGREVKTSKLTYKLFGLPGVLAKKHYKRNKKKYRTTVLSLFMSIVLFVSASAFTDYLMEMVLGGFGPAGYDLRMEASVNAFDALTPDELLAQMKAARSVTGGAYYMEYVWLPTIETKDLTEEGLDYLNKNEGPSDSQTSRRVSTYISFVDDATFKALLDEHGLSQEKFMDPEHPLGIAVDGLTRFDLHTKKYETTKLFSSNTFTLAEQTPVVIPGYYYAGETTDPNGNISALYRKADAGVDGPEERWLSTGEATRKVELHIGKTVYEKPFFLSASYGARVIYPISLQDKIFPELNEAQIGYYFMLISDNHTASFTALKAVLTDNGFNENNLQDIAQQEESDRNLITIIRVFVYGFILVICLIAAANVFNTISTNISLRRREFAMLKSVGMTQKGFHKMMNFECLLYGTKALLYGLPVSCGITYLIYLSIMEGYETTFHLPWMAIGIAVLSVFLVVGATMMYSMSKVKKDNPIDALKNENL